MPPRKRVLRKLLLSFTPVKGGHLPGHQGASLRRLGLALPEITACHRTREHSWVWIPASPLPSCVTWGMLLDLSELPFVHLQLNDKSTHYIGCLENLWIKCLVNSRPAFTVTITATVSRNSVPSSRQLCLDIFRWDTHYVQGTWIHKVDGFFSHTELTPHKPH